MSNEVKAHNNKNSIYLSYSMFMDNKGAITSRSKKKADIQILNCQQKRGQNVAIPHTQSLSLLS